MATAKESTRVRIIEAAEAVFADKGYHDALVDEIVQATELSKGGVYFHFPSKEKLFYAVLDRLAGRLAASAELAAEKQSSPLARADAAMTAVIVALSKRRRLARLLMLQGYSMGNAFERKRVEVFERFAGLIERHLKEAERVGEIAPVDAPLAARVWLGALNEVVIHWLYSGGPPPSAAGPLLRRILIGGLAAPYAAGRETAGG